MIRPGDPAPELALEDTTGNEVRLADLHGRCGVLLFFMRSASCPVCHAHVRDLAKRQDYFRANNIRVLVAVPEDRATAAAWKERSHTPFPVLTGRTGTPHEAFGLARRLFGTMQQSGSVLIDPQGTVRHAHGATSPLNSYDKKGITAAITDGSSRWAVRR